jgi:GTP cyclohydrolase II
VAARPVGIAALGGTVGLRQSGVDPTSKRSALQPSVAKVRIRTEITIPITGGPIAARFYTFDGLAAGIEHFLVALGPHEQPEIPLVRIHSECITGDLFGSQRCDCGPQLHEALQRLQEEGGYLVYLRQEGRGIGLYAKLDAYVLQDQGLDTYEANRHLNYPDDLRDYEVAADMLRAIGVTRLRLLTNNPQKVEHLHECGLEVEEVVRTGVFINDVNARYLATKVQRARHTIQLTDDGRDTDTGVIST